MFNINKRYKAIILDFEKTLVNLNIDWDPLRKTYSDIFKKYGFDIDYKSLKPIHEQTANQIRIARRLMSPKKIYSQLAEDLLLAQKKIEHRSLDRVVLFKDTKPFLKYVTARGLKTAILTSNLSSTVKKVFSKFGILFDGFIIGREDVTYPKPDLQGIKKLLRKLDLDGKDCILIGDTDFDIAIGKKINSLTIFLKRDKSINLSFVKPDIVADSLSEIILIYIF